MLKLSCLFVKIPKFYCFGGGGTPSAPPPPPPPPPPPQIAQAPSAAAVKAEAGIQNIGQGGGPANATLLTGGQGDPNLDKLGTKTLLGR